MAVKARWHQGVVVREDPDDDPLATRVEQVGLPITLHEDHAALNERMVELVQVESRLYNVGVTCSIRDRQDTSCNACPISAHEEETELAALCRCGREQERVATEMAVAVEAQRARSGQSAT